MTSRSGHMTYVALGYGGAYTTEIGTARTRAEAEALIAAFKLDLIRRCYSTGHFTFWIHEEVAEEIEITCDGRFE